MGSPHNPQQYQDDPSSAIPGNIYPSMLPNQQAVPPGTGNKPVNSNANQQTSSSGQSNQSQWTATGQVANPEAQSEAVVVVHCDKYGEPIDAPAQRLRTRRQRTSPEGSEPAQEAAKKSLPSGLSFILGAWLLMAVGIILSCLISGCTCNGGIVCDYLNADDGVHAEFDSPSERCYADKPCPEKMVCNYESNGSGFCEPCPDDCLREAYIRPEGNYACCRTTTCPSQSTEMCVKMTLEEIIAHHRGR